MSGTEYYRQPRGEDFTGNVTVRRSTKQRQSKMALTSPEGRESMTDMGSLLIDSILSQSEEVEIRKMLDIEGKAMGEFLPFTSTQMGGITKGRPSLLMSPIMDRDYRNPSCGELDDDNLELSLLRNNRFAALSGDVDMNLRNNQDSGNIAVSGSEGSKFERSGNNGYGEALHEGDALPGGINKDARPLDDPDTAVEAGVTSTSEGSAGLSKEGMGGDGEEVTGANNAREDDDIGAQVDELNLGQVAVKLRSVDSLLHRLGNKSDELTDTVLGLQQSL